MTSRLRSNRIPLALAVVALVGAGDAAATRSARAPTPSQATAAFAGLIESRYGDQRGLRRCAPVDYSKTYVTCWAEIYRGKLRRMISANASLRGSEVVFARVSVRRWARRWSPLPTHVAREFGAPGTASANSPAFDWAFLIGFAYDAFRRHRLPASSFAVDGDRNGMPAAMFRFRCALSGRIVTCSNALGDGLRYAPAG